MRLKGLDLNLLVALNALLEESSVSRAAQRLHITQSAASAALGRLCGYFDDEILMLHGKSMIPTSYAQSLMPEISRILNSIDVMISRTSDFDPTSVRGATRGHRLRPQSDFRRPHDGGRFLWCPAH